MTAVYESFAIQVLSLYSYSIEAPRQALHRVANLSELPHATGASLDVLTQRAERDKLDTAIRLGAPVDLFLVAWALQVLVEAGERRKRVIAQEALVRLAVPRAVRRPYLHRRGRLIPARPTE